MASGDAFFSLQSKLIAAFVAVALVALALAGSVFVFVRRGEQEEQALDHVIATSPAIYSEFNFLQRRGESPRVLADFVHAAADLHDVRTLLINRANGEVISDSADDLTGQRVVVPGDLRETISQPIGGQPYVAWHPRDDGPAGDLILVSSVPTRIERFRSIIPNEDDGYWLVLAVPESTITRAWQGLLPGLGLAAAFAVPAAVLLAVIVARYITRPLQQLTVASRRMAEGTFDVEISVDRSDEVGQLARAFSTMVSRVGEANTQMRELVANVSHDLKTPLTSIVGFAQALRDGGGTSDAEVRRMGGVIYEEAERLSVRLNDLLYLSELEAGQALLQRDEVDLRRLIEGIVERMRPDLEQRGVTLDLRLADGIVLAADGPKLERALENLLDNARKYAPDGGEIRVRAEVAPGAPDGVRIEVANAAPDVAPDEVPRLFDRFYRRDRTRGASRGSGLGLPIARELIEMHGGTLEAYTSDGELVFVARLPRRAG